MERLEAALEKARESRRNVLQNEGPEPRERRPAAPVAAELWSSLKEFKISSRAARRHRLAALAAGGQSGSYDLLRSRTMRLMQENQWKSLAVTSPNSGCGKSTVCANLAFSLARQSDVRILVLDFDFRRPALNRALSQRPSSSLYEVFQGKVRAEDHFIRYGDNLAFGLNTRPLANSAELLQSKATHERIKRLADRFKPDFLLFDVPPMLASDDHVGFLPHVDCAMLVGAAESTTMTQLDICEKELAELTNVLGLVLNKCRFPEESSTYSYEYA